MFSYIFRKLGYLNARQQIVDTLNQDTHKPKPDKTEIGKKMKDNLTKLTSTLSDSSDVKVHPFRFGPKESFSATMVFIDGLVDNVSLTDSILRPLKSWEPDEDLGGKEKLIDQIIQKALCSGDNTTTSYLAELALACMSGDTVILVEGCSTAIIVSTKGWEKRSISEPQSETVVRGPREGFTENLRTNTALIRRKIKCGDLCVENLTVGRKTQTNLCLMYLKNIADASVVETVKFRINNIDIDSVLESGYIEEYIEDAPFSPFSTVGYSEKPDVVAARLLEGRVAIVIDGTPFVLTVPMLFVESFQTAEDYYTRPFYASVMRILRFAAYFLTIFAPALYISLTTFHQEFIPTTLLFTIANAREGTPFPVLLETLIMLFAFEILREAGIRLPRPVGQAISIVGALIMGDAAVSAGLVGAPVVITIAFTAVTGFLVPGQYDSASVLRVATMLLAALLGWYGISMGLLAVLFHLGSLSSFGVTYFDGFSWTRNQQDSLVRLPLWLMLKRPKGLAAGDVTRRKVIIPPLRPHAQDEE